MGVLEEEYGYVGIGLLVLVLLTVFTLLSDVPSSGFASGEMVSLTVQTPHGAFAAVVSSTELFSAEPEVLMFSPMGALREETIQCAMNCVKIK